MMMTAHPSSAEQKKDLHIGGLGRTSSVTLAGVAEPMRAAADTWLDRARDVAEGADEYLRANPWAALAIAAAVGLAAGYLLARPSKA